MEYKMLYILLVLLLSYTASGEFDEKVFCVSHPTQMYPHPEICTKFVVCSNGYGYLQSCPGNMAYDTKAKICTNEARVNCKSHYEPQGTPYSPTFPRYNINNSPTLNPAGYEPRIEPRIHSDSSQSHQNPLLDFKLHRSENLNQHGPKPAAKYSEGSQTRSVPPHPKNPLHGRPSHGPHDDNKDMVHTVHDEIPYPDLPHLKSAGQIPVPTGHASTKPAVRNGHRFDHRNAIRDPPQRAVSEKEIWCTRDGLFQHPYDCEQYVTCAVGHAYITQCAKGTYFNPITQNCGYGRDFCKSGNRNPPKPLWAEQPFPTNSYRDLENHDRGSYDQDRRPINNELDLFDWAKDDENLQQARETHGGMVEYVMSHMDDLKTRATSRTREMYEEESRMAQQMRDFDRRLNLKQLVSPQKRLSRPSRGAFSGVQAFLGSTPYVKQLSVPAFYQLEALRLIKDKYGLPIDEFKSLMSDLPAFLTPSNLPVSPDMTLPIPALGVCPYPTNDENNMCDSKDKYRSYDGSCNNLRRPLFGKSMRPLSRFLPQDYEDGIGLPRVARSGQQLPSARAVSLALFEDRDKPSHIHTLMHMTFGQFLDHDLSRAAVTKLSKNVTGDGEMVDVTCGESECETEGLENRACLPISLPYNDPDFSKTNKTCLMFVRTQEVPSDDCRPGPREQINQLTSHLDASMIYGNDKKQADDFRDTTQSERGKLRTTNHPYERRYKDLLPTKENKDCRDLNDTIQCFHAGDGRLNEHVGLSSVHTVFHRGHNSIEDKLHSLNPHWDGERLYQETRRIVGAAWQYIVYNEYLPLVMGPRGMDQFGLTLIKNGYWDGYDQTVSTDVTNVFSTAAFRFGHSQVDELIRFAHQAYGKYTDQEISTVFRRPGKVYDTGLPGGSGVDSIILGHISQAAQMVDRFFSKQITVHLFSEDPPKQPGTDLPSLNVQRGRDHGLPGYNEWREWCGLARAKSFDDLADMSPEIRHRFRQLYESVDDVDLFAGGIAEEHIPGGMVGPTFGCIIGRQFRNARVGDRFWHERNDQLVGFTPAQLQEIRKYTFARFMCDNMDNVDKIQKFVLLQPISEAFKTMGRQSYAEVYSLASLYRGENNERRYCTDIPDPDLRHWQERRNG